MRKTIWQSFISGNIVACCEFVKTIKSDKKIFGQTTLKLTFEYGKKLSVLKPRHLYHLD